MNRTWRPLPFSQLLAEPLRIGVYKPKAFHGEGVKIVNMGELFGNDFISDQEMKRLRLTQDEKAKALLKDGDLLFARRSVVLAGSGRCVLVANPSEEMTFESSIIRARPNRQIVDPRFLFYSFRSPSLRAAIAGISSQTAVSGIRGSDLAAVQVALPPLGEQHRIAGILSAYDDLIENCERRIRVLDEMAHALYREWFVQFRFPGHEKVPLVGSALGLVPSNWDVVPLESVCERITDGAHSSPKSVDCGYPMASVKDMNDWGFDVAGCRRIGAEDFHELVRNDCKPRRNDVLIAKDGSYLKHTFVVGEEIDIVILSSIAILRPNSRILPNYLNFILRDPATKSRMKGFVSGVAVPRIVLKDFRRFLVRVAAPTLQSKWASHVDPLVDLCRSLIQRAANLRATRDLLLPRLLSGQLPVEPAA